MTLTQNAMHIDALYRLIEKVEAERDRYKAALRKVPEYGERGYCYTCNADDVKHEPHAPDCARQEANR